MQLKQVAATLNACREPRSRKAPWEERRHGSAIGLHGRPCRQRMFLRGPFIPLSHQANDAAYQAVRSARHVLRPSLHWTLLTSLLPYTHAHLGTLLPSQQPWATALGLTLLPPPFCGRHSVIHLPVYGPACQGLVSAAGHPPDYSAKGRGRPWPPAARGGQGAGHGAARAAHPLPGKLVLVGGRTDCGRCTADSRVRGQVPRHQRPACQH